MIETRHKKWAHFVFHLYLHRLFRRSFHSINLLGEIPGTPLDQPVLLLPNHSSWWDGFLIYLLNEKVSKRPLYLMMLESQLKKYPFFSKVGAFSIDPRHPKGVMASLDYSRTILELPVSPAPIVCLFPQGELRPYHVRPLGLENGFDWIITKLRKQLTILLLGIRIEFLEHQLPEVFFQLGKIEIRNIQKSGKSDLLENSLSRLLDSIQVQIQAGNKGTCLLKGSSSINEKWDSFIKTISRKTGN